MRSRLLLLPVAVAAVLWPAAGRKALSAAQQGARPRLVIAFASFRDRPLHPRVYFYEHDGVGQGSMSGSIPTADLQVDTHPSLARGGRFCAVASEIENQPSDLRVWDRQAGALLGPFPELNGPTPEVGAALSADGAWLAFTAWQRPGGPAGWNIWLYHLTEKKVVDPGLNTDDDELSPALSGEGRYVAWVSSGPQLADVRLWDRVERREVPLPGLNSPRRDLDPSLSADGRWIAFTSDRPGGEGSRDIYLYDRSAGKLVPLPGLNGPGVDQTPSLSPDGRFLAFVAERVSGEGERDVYLYDRSLGRLLPTPGLNSRTEDFDPAVTDLPG